MSNKEFSEKLKAGIELAGKRMVKILLCLPMVRLLSAYLQVNYYK